MLDAPSIFAVPNAPASCRGLINLRGGLVPVFDIRKNLGGGGGYRWVLVVGRGEQAAGLVIDGLPKQVKVTESARMDLTTESEDITAAAVIKAYRIDDKDYHVLNHIALLEKLSQLN